MHMHDLHVVSPGLECSIVPIHVHNAFPLGTKTANVKVDFERNTPVLIIQQQWI